MSPVRLPVTILVAAAALAGCASRLPTPVAVALPLAATPVVPMPAGAWPGMTIPQRTADGQWPTPNLDVTDAGAVWHLRGALNVAALACRAGGDPLVGPYNRWLRQARASLASVERGYAAEWRGQGGAWQAGYDGAMTRLYNFYGQPVPRDGFCAAAAAVLAEVPDVTDADLPAFARARLDLLDQPFTAWWSACEAWITAAAPPQPVVAIAAAASATPGPALAPPHLEVDPAVLQMP